MKPQICLEISSQLNSLGFKLTVISLKRKDKNMHRDAGTSLYIVATNVSFEWNTKQM
jgi:hypothetical protein